MSEKTVFQKIIDREIDSEIVYEDDHCAALRDINPQAPVHVLVVPKKVIPSVDAITADDQQLLGHMWAVIPKVAEQLDISGEYRVVVNCGPSAGQTVDHLHFHLIGGRNLGWPPG